MSRSLREWKLGVLWAINRRECTNWYDSSAVRGVVMFCMAWQLCGSIRWTCRSVIGPHHLSSCWKNKFSNRQVQFVSAAYGAEVLDYGKEFRLSFRVQNEFVYPTIEPILYFVDWSEIGGLEICWSIFKQCRTLVDVLFPRGAIKPPASYKLEYKDTANRRPRNSRTKYIYGLWRHSFWACCWALASYMSWWLRWLGVGRWWF